MKYFLIVYVRSAGRIDTIVEFPARIEPRPIGSGFLLSGDTSTTLTSRLSYSEATRSRPSRSTHGRYFKTTKEILAGCPARTYSQTMVITSRDPDGPLEEFYGDEADEVQRLAGSTNESSAGRESTGSTRWRTPVTGALMAGIALGLREVFEPERHDRIAIEQPAPGQPMEPERYEIHLDPVAPESSFAIYRPWVADGIPVGREAGPDDEGTGAGALGG